MEDPAKNEPLYDQKGIATLLRMAYRAKMSAVLRQAGREYKPNPRHDSTEQWLRNADNCLKAKANPIDFVDALFDMSKGKHHPFAKDLAGVTALQCYAAWMQVRSTVNEMGTSVAAFRGDSGVEEDIKFRMVQVCRIMLDQSGFSEPWRNVRYMMDDWCLLRDWPDVRVALAGKHGMTSCVKKYAAAAYAYLRDRPFHIEVYRKLGYDITSYLKPHGY